MNYQWHLYYHQIISMCTQDNIQVIPKYCGEFHVMFYCLQAVVSAGGSLLFFVKYSSMYGIELWHMYVLCL